MNTSIKPLLLLPLAFAACSLSLNAGDPYSEIPDAKNSAKMCIPEDKVWTVTAGLGYLQAQANEIVLQGPGPGGVTSLLVWNVNDALTFNFGLKREIGQRLSFYGDTVVSLTADNSHMVDFDWLGTTGMVTDQSLHPDTDLNHYFQLDTGVEYLALDRERVDFLLRFGFRYTDISMDAYGGSFQYTTDPINGPFFDDIGNFPNGVVAISYRQKFPGLYLAPMLEIQATERLKLSIGGLAGYTFSASDRDHHWARNTRFDGDLDTRPFYGARVGAEYQLTPCSSVYVVGKYDRYLTAVGDVSINTAGVTTSSPRGEAANLTTWQIDTGVKIKF